MHSLETGIIISIASFFFLSFLTFAFLREVNINNEIVAKYEVEDKKYKENVKNEYAPDILNNIVNVIIEKGDMYVGRE